MDEFWSETFCATERKGSDAMKMQISLAQKGSSFSPINHLPLGFLAVCTLAYNPIRKCVAFFAVSAFIFLLVKEFVLFPTLRDDSPPPFPIKTIPKMLGTLVTSKGKQQKQSPSNRGD